MPGLMVLGANLNRPIGNSVLQSNFRAAESAAPPELAAAASDRLLDGDPISRAQPSSNLWSILGLAVAALSTSAWSLYTVEHVKNWAIDLAARGETPALARLAGALDPVDYALASTALVI